MKEPVIILPDEALIEEFSLWAPLSRSFTSDVELARVTIDYYRDLCQKGDAIGATGLADGMKRVVTDGWSRSRELESGKPSSILPKVH